MLLKKNFYCSSLFLMALLWCAFIHVAQADEPFRLHRKDHFFTLPIHSDNIVFIGNSITNMHEWHEAFNQPLVLNRGISGAISDELLEQVEAYVAHHPKKVFLMIGTNDLGTSGMNNPEYPFRNFREIIERIQTAAPRTKIYVQSVLPVAADNKRSAQSIMQLNQWMKDYCAQHQLTYIDLWSHFVAPGTTHLREDFTFDGLHPTVKGYQTWCKVIAPFVGDSCSYPHIVDNNSNGVKYSEGMRITSFAYLPVTSKDVLFLGDEMVHGCEWHELFPQLSIKSRGIGWGYPGSGLNVLVRATPLILNGNPQQQAPDKVVIYAGTADANGYGDLQHKIGRYEALINEIQTRAPKTKIYILSLMPSISASFNTKVYIPFNQALHDLAVRLGATYIDIYTPFLEKGALQTKYSQGFYVNGLGYVKLAQILAPYLNTKAAMTEVEASAQYADNQARVEVGKDVYLLHQLLNNNQLDTTAQKRIQTAIKNAKKHLQSNKMTPEQWYAIRRQLDFLLISPNKR